MADEPALVSDPKSALQSRAVKKTALLSAIGLLTLLGGYLLLHLPSLTLLPVFADEAIYIRWAQLILDDWQQYLFFPLNDGKTPLFVWLTVGALKLVADPLAAGRLISVAAGFGQVWLTGQIVKKLGGKTLAVGIAMAATMILPFWYFYHRMALMDGLLTAFLSLSWLYVLNTVNAKKLAWRSIIVAGLFFGLALLTKIPALLFTPTLLLAPFLVRTKKIPLSTILSWGAATLLIGIGVFLSLKLHPAFGQLFNRGNDFLYSISELREQGLWRVMMVNSRAVIAALGLYLTWPFFLLPLGGLFQDRWRRKHLLLLLSAAGFLAPIILLGKTIYPRYFLPAAVPLTVSASLTFGQFFAHTQKLIKKPFPFFMRSAFIVLGLTAVLSTALEFIFISWQNPSYLPLTSIDQTQYVREWSSGTGVKEATDLLLEKSQAHSIAVATEGFFGTLPDGMLMYLHNQDVTNILVEGIGQPVVAIPASFTAKAQHYEQVWLVVNDHREEMKLNENYLDSLLIAWYCRIPGAPCLQVWDITSLVKSE
ncbi:MAG: hypothetical protein UY13_C0002G0263 [Candidatus Pacebacteria bacterium GW2011_GWB1_47_8]|nr:MAG: hypothetical protein UX28_C0001G0411 [Candidatus Pacebacteria bacterium GW2011_GWA1_46_10]KKU84351.1 MAG: hypothetical protein UY13_C0002G0263 [Candidatus Pacebacteria bacterium GW2011_GWB1_47_8]